MPPHDGQRDAWYEALAYVVVEVVNAITRWQVMLMILLTFLLYQGIVRWEEVIVLLKSINWPG